MLLFFIQKRHWKCWSSAARRGGKWRKGKLWHFFRFCDNNKTSFYKWRLENEDKFSVIVQCSSFHCLFLWFLSCKHQIVREKMFTLNLSVKCEKNWKVDWNFDGIFNGFLIFQIFWLCHFGIFVIFVSYYEFLKGPELKIFFSYSIQMEFEYSKNSKKQKPLNC